MASYNRVVLIGNLTRDPELRHAPSGTPVAEFRLAVNETYRDRQTGQPREVACFVDIVAWDRLAQLCQQHLVKGRSVLIEGRLAYDEWKSPQGELRSKLRVRADRLHFMDAAPKRAEAAGTASSPAAEPGGEKSAGADVMDFPAEGGGTGNEENLPF